MTGNGVTGVGARPRAFVRVSGPQAGDFLQRMVSNDVLALGPGEACEALLLTARARVIAPLVVWRRGRDDYLLLTEPELGETVRTHLAHMRFAARVDIEPEEHVSHVLLGATGDGIPNREFGVPAREVLDDGCVPTVAPDRLEVLRIEAGTPRWGAEIDDRVLPAEAGLIERAVSFTKGCYPGQEPIARLHYRGHANRGLRRLLVEGGLPAAGTPVVVDGRDVGRVTSAARRPDGAVVALAYVRREVPEDAAVDVGPYRARPLDSTLPRP